MAVWVISDLHLGNLNIWSKYEINTRPFHSQGEHDCAIINAWNSVVSPDDLVFVLGDFIMGSSDKVVELLYRLNGQIILITGNHDTTRKLEIYQEHSDKILDIADYDVFYYKGKFFVMNHYPLEGDCGPKKQHLLSDGWEKAITSFQELKDAGAEVYYLYGHVHSNAPHGLVNNTFHVGVDTNNLMPINIENVAE